MPEINTAHVFVPDDLFTGAADETKVGTAEMGAAIIAARTQ